MKQPIRLLVTGNRDWSDVETIRAWLVAINWGWLTLRAPDELRPTLIHGAAKGADAIAADVAESLGWHVEAYPADWTTHGKAAGPIRNRLMAEQGKPTLGLAFGRLNDGKKRTGMGNMVDVLNAMGVGVRVVSVPGDVP